MRSRNGPLGRSAGTCEQGVERPYVSIVVPCHNEADGLGELYRRTSAVLDDLMEACELVLVNDGSTDDTWRRMTAIRASDRRVVAVNLSRNFGQQAAITAGLAQARGERVLVLDADLQDPPELLPGMLELMDAGAEVVHGKRRERIGETRLKRVTASGFYRLLEKLSETPIARDTGEFKLLSRRVVDAVQSLPERHRFTRGLVSWVGFRQVSIEYDRDARFAGATHWPMGKMVRLAMDALTSFSTRPLALAGWLGLAASGAGAALLAAFVISWMLYGSVSTALGIMSGVSLLSGTQMLMLGILGAYVGRLYDESRGRPLYIVRDVVDGGNDVGSAPDWGPGAAACAGGLLDELGHRLGSAPATDESTEGAEGAAVRFDLVLEVALGRVVE